MQSSLNLWNHLPEAAAGSIRKLNLLYQAVTSTGQQLCWKNTELHLPSSFIKITLPHAVVPVCLLHESPSITAIIVLQWNVFCKGNSYSVNLYILKQLNKLKDHYSSYRIYQNLQTIDNWLKLMLLGLINLFLIILYSSKKNFFE